MTTRRSGLRGRMVLFALALFVAAMAVPVPADTQTLYGSVTGTVSDPQGAALPGVTVTATNTGTGLKLEQVTDGT
ncbi:MAG TPA: carboxypeptidase-like regulatory domain-containing protein, partial [Vicinamibacterales bacterium]|nr:carboxypeptidase-like regulatory domain-containing protein [Vicinamibacterales bacterium]